MIRRELGQTLLDVVDALTPPESPLVVTEARVDVPLEVWTGTEDGKLVFYGNAPHSRWLSGVLPQVQLSRLRIELVEERRGDDR